MINTTWVDLGPQEQGVQVFQELTFRGIVSSITINITCIEIFSIKGVSDQPHETPTWS